MMTSPSLITGPAPSFWAEQDRVSDSPPILRARPEDGRHDQLGIFQTALLGRITQASTPIVRPWSPLHVGAAHRASVWELRGQQKTLAKCPVSGRGIFIDVLNSIIVFPN